ncbi:MAG: DUF485 domain-containing protein [Coriobacteriia bacterium]|nr:DUF485 domain-containing protein [Coriobacteriia bacterium]
MSKGITSEKGRVETLGGKVIMRVGTHVDTLETVDEVFKVQRRLSFTYGAVFFAVTLAIPAGSVWIESWYATTIWGGFTPNYLFVSLLYFVFLWGMAWTYSVQADKLDDKINDMADAAEAKLMRGGDAS